MGLQGLVQSRSSMKSHSSGCAALLSQIIYLVIDKTYYAKTSGSCRFSTLGISAIITLLLVCYSTCDWVVRGQASYWLTKCCLTLPIPHSPLGSAHHGGGWPFDVCHSNLECSCWLWGHSPLWRGVVHSSRAEHGHQAWGDPHKYRHDHHSQSGALYRVLLQGQGRGVRRSRGLQREAVLH